jgi:hypothetical protein
MAADGGDFLVGESSFNESTDGPMAEIVKVYVGQLQFPFDIQPYRIELVGAALAVPPWLPKKISSVSMGRTG